MKSIQGTSHPLLHPSLFLAITLAFAFVPRADSAPTNQFCNGRIILSRCRRTSIGNPVRNHHSHPSGRTLIREKQTRRPD